MSAPRGRLLELHARWPERYPALLESAARNHKLGRYDLLFAFPQTVIRKRGRESFFDALDREFLSQKSTPIDSSLPFTGGWLVFLGYEIAAEIEPTLQLPASSDPMTALAMRIPAAIIYEHETEQLHLIAEADREELIDRMRIDLDGLNATFAPVTRPTPSPHAWGEGWGEGFDPIQVDEEDPKQFLDSVERAKDYIRAGDVYQVNLSRGWSAHIDPSIRASDLYRALRAANPAPFAASLVTPDWAVLSSSPERLFTIRQDEISTRPIAGTWARSRVNGSDAKEMAGLAAHPKERAEHIMLVDLERNDLGRICVPGSVEVDELLAVESYEHVHHLVSNVRGRLRPALTPASVLRAVFPGGTITGCPKVRCMQIIAELEGVGRGAYTGSIGYLNRDGTGDFNILIRTLTHHRSTGAVRFRAGAGIVADSDPERELEETRAKAKGLLRAFGNIK